MKSAIMTGSILTKTDKGDRRDVTPQARETMAFAPFFVLVLVLPLIVIAVNFVIGIATPITSTPEDDMLLADSVWRLVQGQHLGADFSDPRGFGFFQVAAVLWRFFGAHYFVLRAASDFFAILISICAALMAFRRLREFPILAALLCIAIAFTASAPSIYGSPHDFGMAVSYDRLLMASFAVLLVHSFAREPSLVKKHLFLDPLNTALLLDILLLVKISGLAIGIVIVAAGLIVRLPPSRWFREIVLISLFLVLLIAVELFVTGTSLPAIVQEYALAARARAGSYSIHDLLRYALQWTVVGSVVLMAAYAAFQSRWKLDGKLWRCLVIIVIYWGCQVLLNMTNSIESRSLIDLAPAAAVAVVSWVASADGTAVWRNPWTRWHYWRTHPRFLSDLIAPLIVALVLVPEAISSLRAIRLDYSLSPDSVKSIASVQKPGITYRILTRDTYTTNFALSIGSGVKAIESIGASGETIVNLDEMNPFPAVFLAPSPRGVPVYWDFGNDVPVGYKPSWQEVLGDACIVTEAAFVEEPASEYSQPLLEAVQPHLAEAFTLAYQDDQWKIWKRTNGCAPG